MAALETDGARSELLDLFNRCIRKRLLRSADVGVQAGALVLDLFAVPAIADEQRLALGENEMARIAAEAGEVGDTDRIGDEKQIEPFRGGSVPEPITA